LSVLAGMGAAGLSRAFARRRGARAASALAALVVAGLLFELHAAPMELTYGAVYPDELTLRLRQTPMRGGLVELPTGGGILPHLYMLRAADHEKPLINAISTFVPPQAAEINSLAQATPISDALLDAMEKVPTSYLAIHMSLIDESRRPVFEAFLGHAVATNRLRFIRRFGAGDDLYAVVKTEPEARSEQPAPSMRDWSTMIEQD